MVKLASYINVVPCTNCSDSHIILMDENGEPYAEAILAKEQAKIFVEAIQRVYTGCVEKAEIEP